MLGVTVQGGTSAGTRIIRIGKSWACRCQSADRVRIHPGERYSCSDCGARRP